jgi:hypothetical protein
MNRDVESSGSESPAARLDRLPGGLPWDELAALFRQGHAPAHLPSGEHVGRLLALDLGPLTGIATALARAWMPWRGKWLDADRRVGANLFSRDSLPLLHLLWPTYRGVEHRPGSIYRAFAFSIEERPGLLEPGRRVIAIDYRRPDNPRLLVRQVVDELVELESGLYLGQAIVRLPGLRPERLSRVAYFALAIGPVA